MKILVLLAFATMVTANAIGTPSEELKMDLEDDIDDIPLEHKTINRTFVNDIVRMPGGMKSRSQFRSRIRSRVPEKLCIRVKAFYNRRFRDFVRNNRELRKKRMTDPKKVIKRIFRRANRIYRYPGLRTRIRLHLIAKPEFVADRVADQWEVPETSNWLYHDSLSKRIDGSADHFAFFCHTDNTYDSTFGRAIVGSVCRVPQSRRSLNEFTNSIRYTANIVAHEIGHALGMSHDFIEDPNYPRYAGRENCNIGGVMGYSIKPYKWSKCSRNDFENYWKNYCGRKSMKCRK